MPEFVIIQALVEVPYYFKLEKEDSLIKILTETIINGLKTQPENLYDIFNASIFILGELLCLPITLQYYQLTGECNTHSNNEFIALLGKHPMLVYCLNCSKALCISCFNALHATHQKKYLLYLSPHSRCICDKSNHDQIPLTFIDFTLPRYTETFHFMLSNGNRVKEDKANIFETNDELSIITSQPIYEEVKHGDRGGTLAYFEVRVLRAGMYENITIELVGTGASYCGKNGNVVINDRVVMKGPRFSS